ncbi:MULTISPECIES: amino acid permease [Yersinia]|uniref:Transporter, basic amino acid/polyamine antiporter family protein n=1 Tax=Yersinia rochesterensis TaxID=1604335 RepID=A0ABN4FCR4_9GAMM|nr:MULTISPECIES: amino acid permease [Yersinia]AJI87045.1 transporter, basic amino acid/polyamine antiporter family protein [Yersinia frederiksenii Y225]CRY62547.1 arginine/ornithine antiporter [Yersinia kristensenii]AIN16776.1 transporter, basic amino acid/polyamine antiporter family protein [Yersinia rochesterensis]AJJ35169.1 transporter, basic amino acid/polyamine antiporter family protein [Yersinia rochesterensis]MDA5546033.1 amino acid permease [Yersinia rochesterensis]
MANSSTNKLSLPALTSLVVGSMIGAGIFSLPATFGRATGGFGALIAWCIAGGGMLMLAFVFQTLAQRKPNLDSGVFIYAKEGFGDYLGFAAALGFWAGTCIGNVSYFVLIKSTLGAFFPIFGDGNTIPAVLVASVILWGFHILILRGVKEAAAINTIATFAKIIPIFIFVIVLIFAFKGDVFALNFWGTPDVVKSVDLSHLNDYGYVGHAAAVMPVVAEPESLFSQVRSTMLVTVFVFLGIEGASVYSRYAKERSHVGIATVLGFIGVLCLLVLITMLSYGVLLRPDLAALRQPSMAGVLEAIVGRWGAIFISVGLIISVLGAYLSWSLLAAEVLFSAAKSKSMPKVFATENRNSVPSAAVWLTNIFIQVFLILTLFTDYAFQLALELTSSLTLIPYLLVGAYGLKLAWTGETYETNKQGHRKDLIFAIIATFYSALMIYAGGMKYLLLSAIIYGPGTILYLIAKREQHQKAFNTYERILFIVLIVAAVAAIYSIATGIITI